MDMVIDNVNDMSMYNYNNYNEVRSCMLTPNSQRFRFLSMFSKLSKEEYIIRVQHKSNRMVEDKQNVPFNSPLLEYAMQRNQTKQVSEATNNMNNMGQQHVIHDALALNSNNMVIDNNMFNVQLQYNINQALDPESWNSNFHAISLYGSMKHLVSDIKNIQVSLDRMQKYILGKTIECYD